MVIFPDNVFGNYFRAIGENCVDFLLGHHPCKLSWDYVGSSIRIAPDAGFGSSVTRSAMSRGAKIVDDGVRLFGG